jgi:hypothetical protein
VNYLPFSITQEVIMSTMIVSTSKNEYEVKWVASGLGDAVCLVSRIEYKKFFCFKLASVTKVWEGNVVKPIAQAEKSLPEELKEWYEASVKEYEDYQKAWAEWDAKHVKI